MKQRYDSYKPSGIDWIGDIPSHWTLSKIKFIGEIRGRIGFRGYTTADLVSEGEGALTIGGKHISNNVIDLTDPEYISWDKYYESPEIMVSKGDIVIAQRGTLKRTAYISKNIGPATINPSLVLLTNIKINPKYLHSYLCSNAMTEFIDYLNTATAVPMISQNQIENIRIIEPPLAEQEAIAAWLDEKCGEIDAAIAKVDREIELIDELKQSEISRVVTRGLNPDASLRSSGIDWIGDIPKQWKINKLKYHSDIFSGEGLPMIYQTDDPEIPVYGGGGILGYSKVANNLGNTLILGRVGGDGTVRHINNKFWATDNALIINTTLNKTFLCCILNRANLIKLNTSTAQPLLTATKIKNVEIPVPPLSEQQAIADYLDAKCAEIDRLKGKLTKKRETLTELRQSIISEVVTGKRKVI